ncbi:MAG: DNA polymerase/3'-5' exonuclease PolX [Lentisphaeria bacterium]|nr:DNA polymerase/3'-5' exonuclease PolX [Lentisphaeria bacterium]
MNRKEIVKRLEETALLLDLDGANPFRIRSFENAGRSLNRFGSDLIAAIEDGSIVKEQGVGKGILGFLKELVDNGEPELLKDLRGKFPATLSEILELNGVGPKKVKQYYETLKVTSVEELKLACEDGRVAALPRSGQKTADKILVAIDERERFESVFLYYDTQLYAKQIVERLLKTGLFEKLSIAGSLRRGKELTKDMDLLGVSSTPKMAMQALVEDPYIERILVQGETKSSIRLKSGLQVDLRIVPEASYPAALQYFTGSQAHNIYVRSVANKMGLRLNEWGLFKDGSETPIELDSEAAIYERLGMIYPEPEMREGMLELREDFSDVQKNIITKDHYKGSLHNHTFESDGSVSLAEMCATAKDLGHQYIGITDHSVSSFQANGLSEERLLKQVEDIQAINQTYTGFEAFASVECDIHKDGTLDYSDNVLAKLSYVIVSVHNAFTLSEEDQTKRIIKAIEHPASKILAHPTGRLLKRREGYALNVEKVLDAAIANKVAIELNCNPKRLDLSWDTLARYVDKGLICTVNPDAHSPQNLDFIDLGITFMRKAGIPQSRILNCWSKAELISNGFLKG